MLHVRLGLALLCTVSSALRTPPVLPKTTPPAAATQLEHKTVFSSPGWAARQQASRAPIIKARSSAARAPALRVQGGRGSAHSSNVFGQLARDAAASSVTAVSKMVRNYKGDEEETSAAQDVELAVDSAVKGGATLAGLVVLKNVLVGALNAGVTVAGAAAIGPSFKLLGLAGTGAMMLGENETLGADLTIEEMPREIGYFMKASWMVGREAMAQSLGPASARPRTLPARQYTLDGQTGRSVSVEPAQPSNRKSVVLSRLTLASTMMLMLCGGGALLTNGRYSPLILRRVTSAAMLPVALVKLLIAKMGVASSGALAAMV